VKKEALILAILLILLFGCAKSKLAEEKPTSTPTTKIDDLKATACEEADKAGTCQTRLIEVGIVMPEDCCKSLKRCC